MPKPTNKRASKTIAARTVAIRNQLFESVLIAILQGTGPKVFCFGLKDVLRDPHHVPSRADIGHVFEIAFATADFVFVAKGGADHALAEAVADEQHPDHQFGIDREATRRAVERRQMPPQRIGVSPCTSPRAV